ncbi:FCD domain-containing protein [Thermopolyspora sp. NPDC052614]|uniref:FadR/GntR family transcriptional regulator n=1 Tax=Thermopolyspora sp. NPDC052614 TaxID=3155682 RepID=UPI00341F4ED1
MSNAESAARPAVAPTTPQVIVEHLRGLIHRGEVGPGDRLPPERALAEQLGVARVSVRQALAQLQGEGYLTTRRGAFGGTFVTELVEPRRRWLRRMRENLADLEDILDFRIAVESHAARLAARRRDEENLAAIERAVAQLDDVSDVTSFRAADSAFHQAIAAAARSPRLTAAITDTRGLLFLPTDAFVYPPDVAQTRRDHRRIAAALRRGDQEESAAAMIEHIESTRTWLRQILTRSAPASIGESDPPDDTAAPRD